MTFYFRFKFFELKMCLIILQHPPFPAFLQLLAFALLTADGLWYYVN